VGQGMGKEMIHRCAASDGPCIIIIVPIGRRPIWTRKEAHFVSLWALAVG